MTVSDLAQRIARANPKLLPLIDRISSFFSRRVIDQDNAVQFDADDLGTSLSNLLASSGAAAKISTLTTGTDLTASGVLTTLATNVGAHNAQAITLKNALNDVTGSGIASPNGTRWKIAVSNAGDISAVQV